MGLKSDDAMLLVRTRVHSKLVRTPGWCIALDGVLDADVLAAFIPWDEEVGGHVLVTSCVQDLSNAHAFRDPVKQDALVCLHVGPLEPAETVELLLSGTSESDQEAAAVVAESISHHAASAARLAAQIHADDTISLAGYCTTLANEQHGGQPGGTGGTALQQKSVSNFNDEGMERPFV